MRAADPSYAAWCMYDPAYAAPEVISAAIAAPQVPDLEPQVIGNDEGVSPAADLWSLGMLLFHAASGGPYWPRLYTQLDMVQCLLGHVSLPHEASPHMLDAAGVLSPIVSRLLSRSPEARPSVLDVGEFAAHGVTEAVMGLTSSDVCFWLPLRWPWGTVTPPAMLQSVYCRSVQPSTLGVTTTTSAVLFRCTSRP